MLKICCFFCRKSFYLSLEVCTYVFMDLLIYKYTLMCMYIIYIHYIYIIYIHTYIYIYVCVCVYIYIYSHIYHICLFKQTQMFICLLRNRYAQLFIKVMLSHFFFFLSFIFFHKLQYLSFVVILIMHGRVSMVFRQTN